MKGYRKLSDDEIGLINSLKTLLGTRVLESLSEVRMHVTRQRAAVASLRQLTVGAVDLEALKAAGITDFDRPWIEVKAELLQRAEDEIHRIDTAQPERWIAVANTHFQQGLMALVRAVEQPEGF